MKRTTTRWLDQMLRDEAEMRAFYQSVGIRPETIELAIQTSGRWRSKRKGMPQSTRARVTTP